MALKLWYLNSPWKFDKENLSQDWVSTSGTLWNIDLKVFWWKNKCILVVCTTQLLDAFVNGRHGMHLMSFVLLYVSSCKSGVPKLGKPRILSACLKNQVTKSAERPKVVDSRLMRRLDGTYTHTHTHTQSNLRNSLSILLVVCDQRRTERPARLGSCRAFSPYPRWRHFASLRRLALVTHRHTLTQHII